MKNSPGKNMPECAWGITLAERQKLFTLQTPSSL